MRSNSMVFVFAVITATPLSAQGAAPAPVPIPRAQFIADMDAEFKRLDSNGDGTLLSAEIAAAQQQAATQIALRQNQAVFAQLDADRNGALSPQEFAKLANTSAIKPNPQALIGPFDQNKDGKVTLLEYRTATQANFDRADADRDGVVTPVEMRAVGVAK